ncbi:hypothetical protein [Aureimonas sp. ME7]|uniref:hypothetical protein n=1 Tax=Aureimonas sp. ME7 TaxID=2744252 RepID=UPI0015F735CA|nr:hypothetical protein [Aureimonas sp. ME7]
MNAPFRRRSLARIAYPDWADPTKSFEVDFVNDRAHRGGIVVPITAIASCVRASSGKAFDGAAWTDIAANLLRYRKGGGLYVEPARTNHIRNADIAGVDASNKPTNWTFNVSGGGSITYAPPSSENGIRYSEFRYQHPGGTNVGLTVDIVVGVACAISQTWTHSAYVSMPAQKTGFSSANIGGRAGGGAQTEFPSSAGFNPDSGLSTLRAHTFTLQQNSTGLNSRVGFNVANGTPIDIVARIGFPMLSMEPAPASFVATPIGSAATRAADQVALTLPSGAHDLTFTFDDASTQTVQNVSGSYAIPTNLNRAVIAKLSGVRR